ncbi:WGR domain-containing protein [Streptomyces kanamyceticus]|uniref:WGR domain-containing protein n=1 Tax=Streptomyces kanamyceticus TaxID=1967 RepID=A0A5J6G7M0_STRKN|nr:WGR domain-containing protein [Streptomyces kanamyceticus]QEU89771.1 WGR domain-containing protein [Streptomyces kanamyceticus]
MSETRYFEKSEGAVVRHWRISRSGIRCHIAWGRVGGRTLGSSMTLDDAAHAVRHVNKKVAEKLRQGYVEVAADPSFAAADAAPDPLADAPLLEVMRVSESQRYAGAWEFFWNGYEEVAGHPGTFAKFHDFRAGPGPFHDYLVLADDGRRGLSFVVKEPGHSRERVSAFLDFVRPRVGLAFDGRSHHKVALPAPVGRLDHVLFCAPSLHGARYGGRLAGAFPVHGCEIADEDTETLVEARIKGRGSLPSTTWDRDPCPVLDLKFDLRRESGFAELGGRSAVREKTFKVYPRPMLERALRLLPEATADSTLEIRNHRREVLTLTPPDLAPGTAAEIDRFLLGGPVLR